MTVRQMLHTLLRNPSGNMGIQLLRYIVTGGIAFIADAGILALLTESFGKGLLPLWTALGFSAGLLITYLFSIKWVFDNRSLSNRYAELTIFIMIGVCGLLLTELFMWIFVRQCAIHYLLSKVITTIIVFAWNFTMKKLLLFRSRKQ